MPCTVRAIQGILNGNIFMKKKLLILTTGGTIACTAGACGYVPTLTAEKILAFVPDPPDAVLSVRAILSKDSSNITPCDWQLIARTINGQRFNKSVKRPKNQLKSAESAIVPKISTFARNVSEISRFSQKAK